MGLRYFCAPAISSSAAVGLSLLVQKMTTCENMIVVFMTAGKAFQDCKKHQGRTSTIARFRLELANGRSKQKRQTCPPPDVAGYQTAPPPEVGGYGIVTLDRVFAGGGAVRGFQRLCAWGRDSSERDDVWSGSEWQ